MRKHLLVFIGLFIFTFGTIYSQSCPTCSAVTSFTANLTSNPNNTYTVSSKRNGLCCQGSGSDNCIRFEVSVHPSATQIQFLVSTGNNGTWEINCAGPLYTPTSKPCLNGLTNFCITYCNPGNSADTYTITTSTGLGTGADLNLRGGCTNSLTVRGLSEPTITWTSVFPGAAGSYNSFLSCLSGCDTTKITPTAGAPAYIDYKVCGSATGCVSTNYCDTQRVYVSPALTVAITPTAPVLCSAGSGSLSLTSSVSGGNLPYTYTWSPGGLTTSSISVNTPGTYSISVNDNTSGCGAITKTITVASATTPTATASPSSQSLCSGQTTSITLSSNSGTTTYSWVTSQSGVTGASNSSGTTITQTLTTTGLSSGTVIYTITPTDAGCSGNPIVVTVTVNPAPTMTVTPGSQALCSGGTTSFSLTSNVAGTTYSWTTTQTNANGASTSSGTLIAQTLTATTTSSGSVVYTITPTYNSCPGTTKTVSVTVNPAPTVTATPNSQSLCSGNTTSIALTGGVAGTTYSWTVTQSGVSGASASSSTNIAQTLSTTGTSLGTAVYTITPTANSCNGTPIVVTVSVSPTPSVTATPSSQTLCSGNTSNIALTSNVAGTTFSWTVTQTGVSGASASSGTNIAQTLSTTSTSSGTAVYTITPSSNGCGGTSTVVTVAVNPTPVMTSTNSATICSGNSFSITLTSNIPSSYTWIAVNNANTTGESTTTQSSSTLSDAITNNVSTSQIVVYTVTPTSTGGSCVGTTQTVSVTVNPVPTVTATPNSQSLCSGNTTSIALTGGVAGTTYSWTVTQSGVSGASASSSTNIAQTLSTTGTSLGTAVYTITPTANSCNGTPIVVTVSVSPTPSVTATPSSQTLCSGNTSNIALTSNVAGTTFSWTVTQTGVSGASASSGTNIAQTLSTTSTSSGTAVYTITPSSNGCGGTSTVVTVAVNPTPVMTSTNSGVICSAGNITIPLTSNVPSSYIWIAADNSNTTGESTTNQSTNSINNTITNSTTSAQIVVYTVTPTSTSGSCVGAPQTVSVTVNPTPVMTSTDAAVACSASSFSIALTSNVASTYTWIAANNPNTTGESITTQTATTLSNVITNTTTSAQVVTYTVTPTTSAGSCAGVSQIINVTVNPKPVMTSTNSAAICSGNSFSIALTSNVASTYTWIAANNPNTTGESTTNQSSSTLSDAITNNVSTSQIVVYTVTPTSTGGSCVGTTQTVSVTVNVVPTLTSATTATICSGGNVVLPLSSNVASTYTWIATDNTNTTGESLTTQNTATINNTIISSSGNTETILYNVTPTSSAGICVGATQTLTVTISPVPTVTLTPSSQAICSGNTATISLSSNVVGTTYTWTSAQTNASGASAGSGTVIAQALTATGVSSGLVTYTITPGIGSCSGSSSVGTVSVNPIPTVTATPSSQVLCSGNTTSISLTSNVSGTTYSWTTSQTNASGSSAGSGTVIAQTLNATSSSQGLIVYTITPTNNGCSGTPVVVSVSVNPTPSLSVTPTSQGLCTGSTTSLTLSSDVAGTTSSWTVNQNNASGASASSGTLIAQTITATTSSVGTVVYTITPSASSCSGAPVIATISVSPIPAAPTATNNGPMCVNGTLVLTAGNITGATYNWSGPNGFTSSVQNPTITSIPFAGAGVYSVNVIVSGCSGPIKTTTVVVNPPPPTTLTVSSNSPLCSTKTISLSVATVTAAIYSWAGPNGFTSTLQNPTITNASTLATGVYSVTATVSGCGSSGTETISVVVNQTPSAPVASNNGPLCVGATLNLSANGTATTYSWTGPGGFTNTNQNPTLASVSLTNAGVYSVTATSNGCTSARGTTTLVINPIPTTPTVSTNAPVCVGQTVSLTTSSVSGATYNWSGPNSYTSSVQNPTVTTNASTLDAGTYSLSVIVNGCASSSGTVNVAVNTAPTTPTASAGTACLGDTLHLFASSSVGSTYSWSGPNGFTSTLQNPFILNATSLANGTYTVFTNNGCASTPALVTVSVTPKPSAPVVSSNSPVCEGATLTFTASNTGTSYNWNGPNAFVSSVQNPTITPVTLLDAGTYSVTATANGCSSSTRTISVVVNAIPSTPTISSNSPICTGQLLSLTSNSITGATYAWSGPNSFTSSVQSPTLSNVTLAQAGNYSLTITVNGCASSSVVVTPVTINATPTTPTLSSNSPLCVGDNLNLTASGTETTYNWSGPNTYTSNVQNPSISNITLTDAGTYSVAATTNGCTSLVGTTTVVINPIPTTPTVSTNAPVCVGQTVSLTTSSVSSATYNWSGPNSYTSSVQNPTVTTNASTLDAGTYSLSVIVNGCASITNTITVSVNNAAASPTVTSNSPICSGDTLFLSAVSVGGATYSWTGPNGFTSTNQNPFIVSTTTLANGTYTVIADNGCASSPAVITVTVNQKPSTPVITSNSPVCTGNNLNLSATFVSGGSYNWSGPNGFTASTQTTTIASVTSSAQGTYSVTVTKNGCTSNTAIKNITVTIAPIANAGISQTVCANNATVALTGTVSGGSSTGIWTSTGTGTFTPSSNSLTTNYIPSNADTTAGSVVLTLTSTNNGGCAASTSSITVTISDAPVAIAGSNFTVCANNPTINLNGIVYGGSSTGAWTTSGSGTFNPNANTLNATYIPSAADTTAGMVTFTLTSTSNGQCFAASSQMTVNISDAPIVNAGPDQITCKATPNAILSGTVSPSNSGIWSTSGTGTFNPNSTTLNPTYIPSSADTAAGSVLLVLTSTNNGGCSAVTDTMKLSFSDIPSVTAGSNQTVCANNSLVALTGTITGGGSTGIWTSSGTGTFTPSATALNASYIPSAADTASGVVTLTLTSTSGCVVVSDNVTITITPAPYVSAGSNISVCSNNSLANYNGSVSGVTSSGIWSSTGSGTFSPDNVTLSGSYTPSAADITSGSVYLILTSTNNGNCNATIDSLKLTITPPPVALAGNDTVICANNNLVLNGVIIGGAGTGVWATSGTGSFTPNSNTLTASYVPSAADTTAHQVVLTLTSTNNGGCLAATDNLTLTINPGPSVNAGVDQSVCSNSNTVSLTGQVTVATGLQWTTLGDGTFSSSTSLATTYSVGINDISNGQVKIVATSTGNGNCTASADTMIITIQQAPIVNAGNNKFICQGIMTVALTGSVSGSTNTGVWSTLGSGTFASSTNLNTTYTLSTADTTAGSVKLILSSTNNGTCNQLNDTILVTITPAGFASVGNDTTVCSNDTIINLTGVIFGGTGAGQWSSNGTGTFSPSNTALATTYILSTADIAAGNVSIKLSPINSCLPTADSLIVTINPKPIVNAGTDQTICTTVSSATLNGTASGGTTTGIWSTLGSGSFSPNATTLNGVYTVSSADSLAGNVNLVLTSTNNGVCNAVTDTVKIFITNSTTALVGNDTTICSIDSLALNGTIIGGTQGQWTSNGSGVFNPNNTSLNATYVPSATDITDGSVIIKLTPTAGCQVTADSLSLTFNLAPVVDAGNNIAICASTNTVALNGSVTIGSTTGIWTSSGSGTFLPNDSTLNGTYQLSTADSTAGSVTLYLTSTHSGGCGAIKDSITITTTLPAFAFVGNDATVCANNISSVLSGTITGGVGQGQWTTNGSGTFAPYDTTMTPSYIPSAADITNGTVIIKLTPINACAPTADSLVLTITPSPTVSAGTDIIMCGGLSPINLSGSINTVPTGAVWSTNGSGTFNPNDSTLTAGYVPSVTDGDTLRFVLTTTGNGLCNAATDTMFVFRNVQPIANFGYTNPCAGQTVTFADSSSASSGTITTWSWNFGNGNISSIQNPTDSYSVSGTYSVSLLINTSDGCSDSITKVITINPTPVSSFSFATACSNDSVRFTSSASVSSGTISSWNWSFGDGNSSALQNPAHVFDSVKVYSVGLTVVSNLGCSSTVTQTVNINPAPIAGFNMQTTCGSLIVNFNDTSIVGAGATYSWTFGDGNVSAIQNSSNTYSTTGTYSVTLEVQSALGCKDTTTSVVNLSQSVVAEYIPQGGSYNVNQTISFTNQSTGASSYQWTFGDGGLDNATDPTHGFSAPGSYSVTLIASNGSGCIDTVAYVFEIKTSGYTVPTAFTPNGDGLNDGFSVIGGPFSDYELRVFNEWGNQIFISNSQGDKWDGTYKGTPQPAGTYIYVFNGKIIDGDDIKLKGEVNLVR